jgi:high-affinity Fe2+/Pb2+ permease
VRRLRRCGGAAVLLALVLGAVWPAVGAACPVCVGGPERNRAAFFGTTVLLSLLPLGMIGAGAWWLARRGGIDLEGEFEEREAPAAPGPALPLTPPSPPPSPGPPARRPA